MFPGPGASIIRNEAGEPLGWDYPSYDESGMDPYEEEEYYRRREPACQECGAPQSDCECCEICGSADHIEDDCPDRPYTEEDWRADEGDRKYHEAVEEDWGRIREAEDANDRHWDGM